MNFLILYFASGNINNEKDFTANLVEIVLFIDKEKTPRNVIGFSASVINVSTLLCMCKNRGTGTYMSI